jgi:hypothetical protein
MPSYKGGHLLPFNGALIHIKDGVAKTVFVFPKDEMLNKIWYIEVTQTEDIIVVFGNDDVRLNLYCLMNGHTKFIPKGEYPQALGDSGNVFATFYPNISVFNTRYIYGYRIFGSCIAFITRTYLYIYSTKTKNMSSPHLPTLPIKWKNCENPSSISLIRLCLIEKITGKPHKYYTDDHYFVFEQGMCVYRICDFKIAFFYTGNENETLVGFSANGRFVEKLAFVKKNNERKIYNILDNSEEKDRCIKMISGTKKTLLFRPKNDNLEYKTLDKKYKFVIRPDSEIHDFFYTEQGLIVLIEDGSCASDEILCETQNNVLIVNAKGWQLIEDKPFGAGIFVCKENGWYYLSLDKQFKLNLIGNGPMEHNLITVMSMPEGMFIVQEFSQDNIDYDHLLEDTKFVFPKFYKIKLIQEDSQVELEIIYHKNKSLIRTIDGFYCFDGHQLIGFHEQINLVLSNFSESQLELLDLDLLSKNALDPEFALILKDSALSSILNDKLDRNYRPVYAPCGDAVVTFAEGDDFLDVVVMAKKVNRHSNRLSFSLIGSIGSGPVRVVSNLIIKEFIESYFVRDGFFWIPTDSFRKMRSKRKRILGWILHNILHLTKTPIGYHLPLAMISSLIQRPPNIFELNHYAKLGDVETYNMLNSMNVLDLQEAGYNTKHDWLSMMCRYSEDDVSLYEPFAQGFRSFSEIDPLNGVNFISADHFLSGSYIIDRSKLVDKLMSSIANIENTKLAEKLIDKLISATESEFQIFVFNLTGTYHLVGDESIIFYKNSNVDYKFSVCEKRLTISEKIRKRNFKVLFDELFSPKQAKMVL